MKAILMELAHQNPVWSHKADHVIGVKVTDPVWKTTYSYERLAVRYVSEGVFEVYCIPFIVYDIQLGDKVNVDENLNIINVVGHSDHAGFRVALGKDQNIQNMIDIVSEDVEVEKFSDKLFALDASNAVSGKALANVLHELESNKVIRQYETIAAH